VHRLDKRAAVAKLGRGPYLVILLSALRSFGESAAKARDGRGGGPLGPLLHFALCSRWLLVALVEL
jgi:hypothetical protein